MPLEFCVNILISSELTRRFLPADRFCSMGGDTIVLHVFGAKPSFVIPEAERLYNPFSGGRLNGKKVANQPTNQPSNQPSKLASSRRRSKQPASIVFDGAFCIRRQSVI